MRGNQIAIISLAALLAVAARAAQAQPVITSGSLSSSVIDVTKPAAAPAISLAIQGQATVVQFTFQGPKDQFANEQFQDNAGFPASVTLQGYTPAPQNASAFQTSFSLYSKPGKWKLVSINICSATVSCNAYGGTALAQLFPSLVVTVRNPNTPDILAPFVTSGTIATPTISLGSGAPLQLSMVGSDDVSGIETVSFCAASTSSTTPICGASQPFYRPALNATLTIVLTLPANTPPGQYTIQSVGATDIAGNFRPYTNAGQINGIFGGNPTFTVTQ